MAERFENEKWFESWFDTKWYHLLYKDRDLEEAKLFISALVEELSLPLSAHLLDAACGAGRHSLQLNSYGYKVHGFDLSQESIISAKQFENNNLTFSVADLRYFKSADQYDAIFSFFTSFGYFDNDNDSIKVLKSFREALSAKGVVLIDFMNSKRAISHLVSKESKRVENTEFNISRSFENGRIIKNINFSAEGEEFSFQEKVSAYSLKNFELMLDKADLKIKKIYGSYFLEDFSEDTSPRLIILAEQKS